MTNNNKRNNKSNNSKRSPKATVDRAGRVDTRKKGPKLGTGDFTASVTSFPLNSSAGAARFELQTGLPSSVGALTLQGTKSGTTYQPLHTYNGYFRVYPGTDSWANEVLEDVIYPWYKNALQAAVAYNIDFPYSDFQNYFHTVMAGLQMYYTLDSVLKYTTNPTVQNLALEYIRQDLTAEVQEQMLLLKERLQACVIPPNIKELIYWQYQIFAMSEIPGAPLMKVNYGGLWNPGADITNTNGGAYRNGPVDPATIRSMLNALLDLSSSDLGAWMTQVFSPWIIYDLAESSAFPIVDDQFTTWFRNLNTVSKASDGEEVSQNTVSDEETNIHYISTTNSIDGAVLSLMNTDYNGTDNFNPDTQGSGLFIPWDGWDTSSTVRCNRCVYNTDSKEFENATSQAEQISIGLSHPYNLSSDSVLQVSYFDTIMVFDLSINTIKQNITDFIRYMFSLNDFKE